MQDLNKAKEELCKYLYTYERYHEHDEVEVFVARELNKTIKGESEAFLDDDNAPLVDYRRILEYMYSLPIT